MSWFYPKRMKARPRAGPRAGNEGEEPPPPFPGVSTFLGLAAVMIVIWLLAYGPPPLFSASDRSVPANSSDTGATK
ncbi:MULTISPECIES: hypothetical protein [unclassified Mesorhizobium]|uniref:hypothetical protein n=1 Tax=Mesorhizobium sp. M1252 TaxID=2957073 RepID=UPI0003D01BBA|nr:hypothetical protein [Mesorhizobium sp. L2C054A000]ESZ52864.1 hypothetical protein X731_01165 [Mesorhizobium sp. L2C054A000]